jgi:hypothetical protein
MPQNRLSLSRAASGPSRAVARWNYPLVCHYLAKQRRLRLMRSSRLTPSSSPTGTHQRRLYVSTPVPKSCPMRHGSGKDPSLWLTGIKIPNPSLLRYNLVSSSFSSVSTIISIGLVLSNDGLPKVYDHRVHSLSRGGENNIVWTEIIP